ncbi:hypothetical protein Bca4012_079454 [Brassica carinata]
MVRTPCCKEEGIKKGAWTPEEDQKLTAYLQLHGEGGWRTLPEKAATCLAGRTDNEIKNYWNTNLKKRLKQKGIDPTAHKPINSTDQTGSEPKHHKLGSSGSARLLNRVASKYSVDSNRDLLTGIIIGNSTNIADVSQSSGDVDSPTKNSTSTLLNQMAAASSGFISIQNNTSTSPGFSDNCSFSDGFTEFFSNDEISGMYTNVDNVGLMEELKDILSYGGADLGDIKDSPEVNVTDDMDFLDSWNKDDDLDLEKFVSSLDSKIGSAVGSRVLQCTGEDCHGLQIGVPVFHD